MVYSVRNWHIASVTNLVGCIRPKHMLWEMLHACNLPMGDCPNWVFPRLCTVPVTSCALLQGADAPWPPALV